MSRCANFQKRSLLEPCLADIHRAPPTKQLSSPNNMPVDPKFIGLAMKAVDKAIDSSYGEKALDRLVPKPEVEKNRKKKRTSRDKRPPGPRRRSERQARRSGRANEDRKVVEEEAPQSQQSQQVIDLNGPGNMSGHTYSTCGTTAKTDKYQLPTPEKD